MNKKKKPVKYQIGGQSPDWTNPTDINGQSQKTPQRLGKDANGNTIDLLTGQVYYPNDPNQANNPNLNLVYNTNMSNSQSQPKSNGQYYMNPLVSKINTGIDLVTGAANLIGSNNAKRLERNQYLNFIQPRAYQNKDEDGLNPAPAYYKNGGKNKKMQKGGKNEIPVGYSKYSGIVNETGNHFNPTNDEWIHNMSQYMIHNNPDSNIYRDEYQHHSLELPQQFPIMPLYQQQQPQQNVQTDQQVQAKYGIHINPANKGKFNATKKRTGKTTEELTHSKDPKTRKRAIFAQNAANFKHQNGGTNNYQYVAYADPKDTNNRKIINTTLQPGFIDAQTGQQTAGNYNYQTPGGSQGVISADEYNKYLQQISANATIKNGVMYSKGLNPADVIPYTHFQNGGGLQMVDDTPEEQYNSSKHGYNESYRPTVPHGWDAKKYKNYFYEFANNNLLQPNAKEKNQMKVAAYKDYKSQVDFNGNYNVDTFNMISPLPSISNVDYQNRYDFQNGGTPAQPITAEAGEIFKDTQGGLNKIPDHLDTHDDSSGGVQVNNAHQVLEDTGDKRNDIDSKLLLIHPKEMLDISGLSIKKPITHSKAFELMTKDADKNSTYIQKYLKRNAASLDDSSHDIYAKNSMDLNANLLEAVPTQADIFNSLFKHQEMTKAKYGIGNAPAAMQNGGSTDSYDQTLKYLNSQRAKQALGNKVDNPNMDYDTEYNNYLQKISSSVVDNPNAGMTSGQLPTNYQGAGITAYRGDRNFKGNASKYTDQQWQQFAKDAGYSGADNRGFQQYLFNMNGANGGPDVQSAIVDLHDKYGNPNTPPSPNSMYNWFDNRLGHRWDKAYDAFYAQKQTGQDDYTPPNDYDIGNLPQNAAPTQMPTVDNLIRGRKNQYVNKVDNSFNAPLQWYDTLPATAAFIDGLQRKGVKYDGIDLSTPQAKYLNPLPTLQQGQEDFNSNLDTLPQNGVGYANSSNVFSQKYKLNDKVLGDYNNANNQIWNANEAATVNTKNQQQQLDQQARQQFESKQLQGIENQRQQIFQSLKDLTGTIAENAKYNREGNLLMKLFPAFDQNANYDGYKYNFYNPGRSNAPAPQQTKKKK